METDILIIGAGLSGLHLATILHEQGRDVRVLEARDRTGGRVLGAAYRAQTYDMGPAWFWRGQPRIAGLIRRHGLTAFEQFSSGALTFEDEHGDVQQVQGFAPMEGSLRLRGGFAALTHAMTRALPTDRIHLGTPVTALSRDGDGFTARSGARSFAANRVVLCLPPRLAAQITSDLVLPRKSMAAVPTWMAGQAKAVAIYETAFWRKAGLSGDAMSRNGPMVEVHDASPASLKRGALFGFIGIPQAERTDEAALRRAVLAQFARLFGPEAADPLAVHIKDWSVDRATATAQDQTAHQAHAAYRPFAPMCDGRLILSGAETAPQFGGYLEGALEAAERAAEQIGRSRKP